MSPLPSFTVMLPSGFKIHLEAVLSTEDIHWSMFRPSKSTMASLGGAPLPPGTTLGGTGWRTSVALGSVGSTSWAWPQGPSRVPRAKNIHLIFAILQFLDPYVPKGNLVPVVLDPQFSGPKGPKPFPIGKLGVGHQFIPTGSMYRKLDDFCSIELHMALVGIVVDHQFHRIPFPGRIYGRLTGGYHVVQGPGQTVAAVLGIGMALIVQDLDFRAGQIGLSILFIFHYPPEDPTVPPFGNVPFQFEHKVGELP